LYNSYKGNPVFPKASQGVLSSFNGEYYRTTLFLSHVLKVLPPVDIKEGQHLGIDTLHLIRTPTALEARECDHGCGIDSIPCITTAVKRLSLSILSVLKGREDRHAWGGKGTPSQILGP
jgi:hypothetical protein